MRMVKHWEHVAWKGSTASIQWVPKAWLDKAWTCFEQEFGLEMSKGPLPPAGFCGKGQSFSGV